MDVYEAMETCRAVRFFKNDPVPDATIDKIIYAATRAPSPGNSQGWDFIVVTDEAKRQTLLKLLAEEEAKLAQIRAKTTKPRSP